MPSAAQVLALSAPLFAPLVAAAPMYARQASATDILVMQFANVLEQLEATFYQQAIAKYSAADFFDYTDPNIAVEQLVAIQADEAAHQSALEAALAGFGAQPISGCTFNLDPFLTDVATTMNAARLVEVTGVAAYMGAAHLISDPRILTAAASILPIEARHQTMLNLLNGGATIPSAFDIPLSPQGVLAIAGPLISGCNLGIQGNTPLSISTPQSFVSPGDLLTFTSDAFQSTDGVFCQMIVGGHTAAVVFPAAQCNVPTGVVGPVAVVITKDNNPLLASDLVDQAADTVLAGPNIIFVDGAEPQQTIANLVLQDNSKLNKLRSGSSSSGSSSSNSSGSSGSTDTTTSTTTLSPDQASSSIAAAESSATDSAGQPVVTDSAGSTGSTVDPAAGGAAASFTTTFEGDVTPKLPAATSPAVNVATGVDSAGQPIATDSAGSTDSTVDPAAGGAADPTGDIIPAIPAAAGASASPAATGDITVAARRPRFMRRMRN